MRNSLVTQGRLVKFFGVVTISVQQEFAYISNLVLWRLRNVLVVILVYYLWNSIYLSGNTKIFGYERAEIMAYIMMLIIVRSLVLSSKVSEVAKDISTGDITNLLVKPISFFNYWMTREFTNKVINLVFAIFETTFLILIFKPDIFIQSNPTYILLFLIALVFAMVNFFLLMFIVSLLPFWIPEGAWGLQFLIPTVIVEFLSGAIFPLDILPKIVQNILNFTPFPYLIFQPINIYLGKVSSYMAIFYILISLLFVVIQYVLLRFVWKKGIKLYEAYGK